MPQDPEITVTDTHEPTDIAVIAGHFAVEAQNSPYLLAKACIAWLSPRQSRAEKLASPSLVLRDGLDVSANLRGDRE